jgi:glycerol uptake facilitator-like aquaporin
VLTFYFVFNVFSTSKMSPNDPVSVGKLAPMAIGFAAFVCHIVGVAFTGASINPGMEKREKKLRSKRDEKGHEG